MNNISPIFNLVCLPFAGAGSSIFNQWKHLDNKFNIISVQLPGREKRFGEPAYRNMPEAVNGVYLDLMKELELSKPTIFFGHSMGAVLSFELALKLSKEKLANVVGLVVSGSPSPYHPRTEKASGLDDNEFIRRVSEFAGYSHPALEDPEMQQILLPTLRADLELHENYVYTAQELLSIPILTIRGATDQLVSSNDVREWSKVTTNKIIHQELPGGHMYLIDEPQNIISLINNFILGDK